MQNSHAYQEEQLRNPIQRGHFAERWDLLELG